METKPFITGDAAQALLEAVTAYLQAYGSKPFDWDDRDNAYLQACAAYRLATGHDFPLEETAE